MENYTVILTSPKIDIPSDNIIEFVKELISSNLVNVDYFGGQLDNPVDYEDDEMIAKRLGTSFINFQFEMDAIDFDDYNNDDAIFQLLINLIESKRVFDIIVDEKDIDIYLYDKR